MDYKSLLAAVEADLKARVRLYADGDAACGCCALFNGAQTAESLAAKLLALPLKPTAWPANADPASPESLLGPDPHKGNLGKLAALCDAVCTLPADRIDVCHMGSEENYWSRAEAEEAVGSLCGQKGATCNSVCWFDARAALKLPPGGWLVRWRVRTHRCVDETFTVRTEAGEEDKARVTVTPVPAALHSRAPPAGMAWALEWKGPAGGEAPQPSADAEWSPAERDVPDGAPEWQYLPVAVVHVKAAAAGAAGDGRALVWAAMEKHDACWVGGLTIDCLQVVPLAGPAAAFAPLPLPPVRDTRGKEVFQGLPVKAAPTDRWEGPHWATRQVV